MLKWSKNGLEQPIALGVTIVTKNLSLHWPSGFKQEQKQKAGPGAGGRATGAAGACLCTRVCVRACREKGWVYASWNLWDGYVSKDRIQPAYSQAIQFFCCRICATFCLACQKLLCIAACIRASVMCGEAKILLVQYLTVTIAWQARMHLIN